MARLTKHLTLERTFEFPGRSEELQERMEFLSANHKRFFCKKLANDSYEISAKLSLGTAHFTGGFGVPIGIQMDIFSNELNYPTVQVSSKIRIEHYLLAGIFAIMILTNLVIGDNVWYLTLVLLGIFIISHFWFHLMYRTQENELIKKLKGQLKLREK